MKASISFTVIAALCLIPCLTFAQKIRIGFRVGPNLTFALYSFPDSTSWVLDHDPSFDLYRRTFSTKPSAGVTMGVVLDYVFSDELFLTTGLNLHAIRYNVTATDLKVGTPSNVIETQYHFNVFAFQLPVMLNYRLGKFSAGTGFYGMWAIAGKVKTQEVISQNSTNSNRKLAFGNGGKNDFRLFDGGLRVEAGYGIKRWRIMTHYDLGLVNVSPTATFADEDIRKYPMKRQTIGLTFIYQPWPR